MQAAAKENDIPEEMSCHGNHPLLSMQLSSNFAIRTKAMLWHMCACTHMHVLEGMGRCARVAVTPSPRDRAILHKKITVAYSDDLSHGGH